jgi:adenylate dimethylallyltransferase (cytokinin synthase)
VSVPRWGHRPTLHSPCCLLWVHIDVVLLAEYLDRRMDDMVCDDMVEELRHYFTVTTAAERAACVAGMGRAIGVPKLGTSFARRASFRAAVGDIKAHTRD